MTLKRHLWIQTLFILAIFLLGSTLAAYIYGEGVFIKAVVRLELLTRLQDAESRFSPFIKTGNWFNLNRQLSLLNKKNSEESMFYYSQDTKRFIPNTLPKILPENLELINCRPASMCPLLETKDRPIRYYIASPIGKLGSDGNSWLIATADPRSTRKEVFVVLAGLIGFFIFGFIAIAVTISVTISRKLLNPISELAEMLTKSDRSSVVSNFQTKPNALAEVSMISNKISEALILLEENNQKRIELEKAAAIGGATQMLAHDVRKPFTMIVALLSVLESVESREKIKDTIALYLPEIKRAIASVNGMIADIMEIGNKNKPITEPTKPSSLIQASLTDVFRYENKVDIQFSFELQHSNFVFAHSLKLVRVFSNIISNASQAMGGKGRIWFKTKNFTVNGYEFVEFCIGNEGKHIPDRDLKFLFEAFYTKGKKGGTGLGLTIAKKIIIAHGGEIKCQSSEGKGVQFFFTLPAAGPERESTQTILPKTSIEIRNQSSEPMIAKGTKLESTIESNLIQKLKEDWSKPLKVLVVDDESIYRQLIADMIESNSDLSALVQIDEAQTGEETVAACTNDKQPDVILMDIDLGEQARDGYQVVRELRSKGLKSVKICMHSNQGGFDHKEAIVSSGADLFLPKPVSRIQFLRLLLSVENPETHIETDYTTIDYVETKHLVILDDNILMLESWTILKSIDQRRFRSPEDFYKALGEDPSILSNALCVITDQHFDDVPSNFDGISFAKRLKNEEVNVPIYLASDGEFASADLGLAIDAKIPKSPREAWVIIQKLLS